jgi:hypothetical protein
LMRRRIWTKVVRQRDQTGFHFGGNPNRHHLA